MKNKILRTLLEATLCPGSPDDSKVCTKCFYRADPTACAKLLKERCYQLLEDLDKVQEDAEMDLTKVTANVLRHIGVPAHLTGYTLLRKAIVKVAQEPSYMESVTKLLYVEVAKESNTTADRVERAIRHAIEAAWDRGDMDVLESYFGNTISLSKCKPTNSEFIATIADQIRLGLKSPT